MTIGKLRMVFLVIVLLTLLSFSCLLAYENVLLQSNVVSLQEVLQELEHQHGRLVRKYDALRASYESLQNDYTLLTNRFEKLKSDYIKLESDYAKLTDDYTSLNETYNALLQNYTILQQQLQGYFELKAKYQELLNEYQILQASYGELREIYENLRFAVYRPLWSNETVRPTISELKKWLAEDDTNTVPYSKWDFVCGDYALMLSVKAKMNRWDMGIVVVLGRDSQGNSFNHAFNAIRCVEGLVYVEPQNDQVFYGPIGEGSWYHHPGFGRIYVESFIVVVPYQI